MPNNNANQARLSPLSDMWLYYIPFQFSDLTNQFQNTLPIKKTIFPITQAQLYSLYDTHPSDIKE